MTENIIPGSFRDPSGYLFTHKNKLYRLISHNYQEHYDHLLNSGLYQKLVDAGLLIPHNEADNSLLKKRTPYKIIQPEKVDFISYPYEWCFSQLKDAALATLKIQKISFEFGMTLKDASAYNIQFHHNRPVLIDTLSFEKYNPGAPWVAYKQFCQHFIAPLALMGHTDVRLNRLFSCYIDGIPLDMASRLLPFSTLLRYSLLLHIHLHAKSQAHFSDKSINSKKYQKTISRTAFQGLVDSLESTIKKITVKKTRTTWEHYYEQHNYSTSSFSAKAQMVNDYINKLRPGKVWDIGANTGYFSRFASNNGIKTISFDIDINAVEKNYQNTIRNKENNLLPLFQDFTNPSPGIGWHNTERSSLVQRGPVDLCLALALVHHLAIANNLPFNKIAAFFSAICSKLIIEFVPKDDPQVQRLLKNREDIFLGYTQQHFEQIFSAYFKIVQSANIPETNRVMYIMENRT